MAVSPKATIHNTVQFCLEVKQVEDFVVIEKNCIVGNDVYLGYYTILRPGVILCDFVEIRAFCFLAEDVHIGYDSHVFQFTNIAKGTVIEEKVWVGVHNVFTNTRNIAHRRPYSTRIYPPHILRGARIGSNCTFLPGVTIGENAMVGAGSIVTKDVPDNMYVFGTPAREIKKVPMIERI